MITEVLKAKEVGVLMHLISLSDTETFLHSYGVAQITLKMLENSTDYSENDKKEIIKGALLHDIGKLFLPFSLTKNGRMFTNLDRDIMETHPLLSKKIIEEQFSEVVNEICLHHHEKIDGSGYPDKLKGDDIPKYVQIVNAADMFEAMTGERAYKKPFNNETAYKLMEQDVKDNKISPEILFLLKNSV